MSAPTKIRFEQDADQNSEQDIHCRKGKGMFKNILSYASI